MIDYDRLYQVCMDVVALSEERGLDRLAPHFGVEDDALAKIALLVADDLVKATVAITRGVGGVQFISPEIYQSTIGTAFIQGLWMGMQLMKDEA